MDNLILSNILFRKTRTATTAAGVALGVVLVVLTVGITHGFLNEQGRRNSAVTAEIIVQSPGSSLVLNLSPALSFPIRVADELRKIEGVRDVAPVGQNVQGHLVDGVEYDSFSHASDMRVIEGRAAASGDEAMIDSFLQKSRHLKVGDPIDVYKRPFHIVGVYSPETLGRIKIPLSTMQKDAAQPGNCTMMLVNVTDPSRQDEVAQRIKERFPDNPVMLTRDIPVLYARGTPALQTFLRVVVVLAIIISSLVILLTMYTTVTERTRQIGVLKSLGASKAWIASQIEKEAVAISALGVLGGYAISVAGKHLIQRLTPLNVELETAWLFYALVLGILAGVAGALYPALRAANQDPVKALSYE